MRSLAALLAALVLAGCSSNAPPTDPPAGAPLRILLPLYVYPDDAALADEWARVAAASERVPISAIINPRDGPADPAHPTADCSADDARAHRDGVAVLRTGGADLRVLGYVPTGYLTDDGAGAQAVRDAIALYAGSGYRVDGIFLDEASYEEENAAVYRQLCSYARSLGFTDVVLNPGQPVHPAYFTGGACSTVVVFENPAARWPGYTLPHDLYGFGPDGLATLVLEQRGGADMRAAVDRTIERHLGQVYVTDDGGDNPWDRLPSYWDDEVAYVARHNADAAGRPARPRRPSAE